MIQILNTDVANQRSILELADRSTQTFHFSSYKYTIQIHIALYFF